MSESIRVIGWTDLPKPSSPAKSAKHVFALDVPGIHVFSRAATRQAVDGRDEPGHDERKFVPQAPGKSRIRLATMPSMISDVPPSIEFAFVRNQARARVPPLERSLSHSSASMPPADIRIS